MSMGWWIDKWAGGSVGMWVDAFVPADRGPVRLCFVFARFAMPTSLWHAAYLVLIGCNISTFF